MNTLSIVNINQALKHLSKSVIYMQGDDLNIVNSIIQKYKVLIDNHNKSTLSVINPTNKELGSVRSSLKKIVISFFAVKPQTKSYVYSERYDNCTCSHDTIKRFDIDTYFCEECELEHKQDELQREKNYHIKKPYYDLCERLKTACDNTKLSDDVISGKILLLRKYGNSYTYDKLGYETNQCLNKMMLEEFIEQNKEFKLNK